MTAVSFPAYEEIPHALVSTDPGGVCFSTHMSSPIPTFGEKIPGIAYVPRRGVYAVVFNTDGQVAAIRSGAAHYLPGGGYEAGETDQETLIREVREECGVEIRIGPFLGEAIDYLYAAGENTHFEKHGFFYTGSFVTPSDSSDLVWIPANRAVTAFRQASHAWAVEITVKGRAG